MTAKKGYHRKTISYDSEDQKKLLAKIKKDGLFSNVQREIRIAIKNHLDTI